MKKKIYLLIIILLWTITCSASESWEILSDRSVIHIGLNTDDFDYEESYDCSVLKVGDTYHMWYTGEGQPSGVANPSFLSKIGYATSIDGENWIKQNNGNPVITFYEIYQIMEEDGTISIFRIDYAHVDRPRVVSTGSGFRIYYLKEEFKEGLPISETEYVGGVYIPETIWTATSTDGINWENHESLGIEADLFSVLYDNGTIHLWYEKDGTIIYNKGGAIAFEAGDANTWENNSLRLGCVIKILDGFKMYYMGNFSEGSDGNVIASIGVATSSDGKKWNKSSDNPVFHNGGIQGISNSSVVLPWVLIDDNYNKMYYTIIPNDNESNTIGLAKEKKIDINNDDKFDLKDIIYGLQILTGEKN